MPEEMGTTISFSREVQMPVGTGHMEAAIEAARHHVFERPSLRGGSTLVDEPVGVVGMITPWNWPVNQIIIKVAPALVAGCTMVLKPSEYSPLSSIMLAELSMTMARELYSRPGTDSSEPRSRSKSL